MLDSLKITVAVGNQIKTTVKVYLLGLNRFYVANFVNTQIKSETSYAPSGTTGFIAANGDI